MMAKDTSHTEAVWFAQLNVEEENRTNVNIKSKNDSVNMEYSNQDDDADVAEYRSK